MKQIPLRILFLCLVLFFGCARAPQVDVSALPPGEWVLDADHASLGFRLDHAKGLSKFTGRFDRFDAVLFFDASRPKNSRLDVHIEAASINTGVLALDQKLIQNKRALDAKTYPVIVFKSQQITPTGEQTGEVQGHLTLHGKTLPVTLQTKWNGSSFDPLRQKQVIGFSAQTSFDRTEFGLDAWKNFGVGTRIEIFIEVEFVKSTKTKEP